MPTGSAFSNVLKAKEDLSKSPEQLEQEKRSVVSQRIPALQVDGKSKEELIEKVCFTYIVLGCLILLIMFTLILFLY